MARSLSDYVVSSSEEFGAHVRAARKAQGLTQIDLAEIAGVGPRFVSELERGKETVRLGLALRITRLLGLDLFAIPRSDQL